jgi:hypothetical protein
MNPLGPTELVLVLVLVTVAIAALVFAAVYLVRQRRDRRNRD